MICSTVSSPPACASRMVAVPIVRLPGAVWIVLCGVRRPDSRATAMVKGLSVEPGSKGSVTALRTGEPRAIVRVVGGQTCQREHLAGQDVQHHDAARLGAMLIHRSLQLRERQTLDLGIQGKRKILAFLGRADAFDILDDLPQPVADDPAAARLAREMVLERELYPLLTCILGARETEHVRHHLAARIVAAVFAVLEQARNAQLGHAVRDLRRDLALDKNEIAACLVDSLPDFLWRHLEQCGQPGKLRLFESHLVGDGPDRVHRPRPRTYLT